MASEPDEPGPSGLTTEEILTLLHTSDSEKEETAANSSHEPLVTNEQMTGRDEDDICQEALDRFERQRAFKPTSFNKVGEV